MADEPKVINMRGIDCNPEEEERFNKWYNERHILDLLKFKGVKGVTRYEIYKVITPDMVSPDVKYPKYLKLPQKRYTINPNRRKRNEVVYKTHTAFKKTIKEATDIDAARINNGRKGSNSISVCNKNSISPYRRKSISFSNVDTSVR